MQENNRRNTRRTSANKKTNMTRRANTNRKVSTNKRTSANRTRKGINPNKAGKEANTKNTKRKYNKKKIVICSLIGIFILLLIVAAIGAGILFGDCHSQDNG